MRTSILGVVLALSMTAPAFASGHVCTGLANTPKGEGVGVEFRVDESGAVVGRSARWTPSSLAGPLTAPIGAGPTLSIDYGRPTESGLGPATSMSGLTAFIANRDVTSDAALTLVLDGDRTRQWSVRPVLSVAAPKTVIGKIMAGFGKLADASTAGGPLNADLLVAVENAKSVSLELREGNSMISPAAVSDLSDHAARDAAFHTAWDAAAKAAQSPSQCDKQG